MARRARLDLVEGRQASSEFRLRRGDLRKVGAAEVEAGDLQPLEVGEERFTDQLRDAAPQMLCGCPCKPVLRDRTLAVQHDDRTRGPAVLVIRVVQAKGLG